MGGPEVCSQEKKLKLQVAKDALIPCIFCEGGGGKLFWKMSCLVMKLDVDNISCLVINQHMKGKNAWQVFVSVTQMQ